MQEHAWERQPRRYGGSSRAKANSLPNSVAVHDTGRHVMGGRAKISRENNTRRNGSSLGWIAANALRMRCSNPFRLI